MISLPEIESGTIMSLIVLIISEPEKLSDVMIDFIDLIVSLPEIESGNFKNLLMKKVSAPVSVS